MNKNLQMSQNMNYHYLFSLYSKIKHKIKIDDIYYCKKIKKAEKFIFEKHKGTLLFYLFLF